MKRSASILLSLAALVATAAGCDRAAPAAGLADAKGVDDLAAEVKAMKELVPDQAHIMADVGYNFTNLWFAGEAENWPLAEFYLGEAKSHFRWAVRAKPIRKDNAGREINLPHILEAFENTQLIQMKQAVDHNDKAILEAVYKESLTACYACHKASSKPYLRPQIPAKSEVGIINFDPKADWPL